MELTYRKCRDYCIPNLALSDTKEYHIGKYGMLRRMFLKEHHSGTYQALLMSEKLYPHLAEIDEACNQRLETMIPEMVKREGVTTELKRTNQMEWVRRMNSIHDRAEEIVLSELVYAW